VVSNFHEFSYLLELSFDGTWLPEEVSLALK
jgi:hypothetical protein